MKQYLEENWRGFTIYYNWQYEDHYGSHYKIVHSNELKLAIKRHYLNLGYLMSLVFFGILANLFESYDLAIIQYPSCFEIKLPLLYKSKSNRFFRIEVQAAMLKHLQIPYTCV